MLCHVSEYLVRSIESANVVMLKLKRRIWWPGTSV